MPEKREQAPQLTKKGTLMSVKSIFEGKEAVYAIIGEAKKGEKWLTKEVQTGWLRVKKNPYHYYITPSSYIDKKLLIGLLHSTSTILKMGNYYIGCENNFKVEEQNEFTNFYIAGANTPQYIYLTERFTRKLWDKGIIAVAGAEPKKKPLDI